MSGNPILRTLAMAATAALLVSALAVPATAGTEMVTICHKPGTNAEGTLEVAEAAVDAHLAHGDTLHECGYVPVFDACTYLNKPDWDGSYASHDPVSLEFVGDEEAWFGTSAVGLCDNRFTITVDGVGTAARCKCRPPDEISSGTSGICSGWVYPTSGVHELGWYTDTGVAVTWSVGCDHQDPAP